VANFGGRELISLIVGTDVIVLTEVSDLNGCTVVGGDGVDGEMRIDQSHLV
jgi:hypothetical protein